MDVQPETNMTTQAQANDPAFITFEMSEKSPRAGTFGCFEMTLALCASMPRSTLLHEAISHCDGCDRGSRPSHWRGVKKADLARFVASMSDRVLWTADNETILLAIEIARQVNRSLCTPTAPHQMGGR